MTKLGELKKKLMENPEFRVEYAQADADYRLIEEMIRVRMEAKLTQSELALKIGTTQSAIARLEGGKVSPSVSTLRRYAEATGHQLKVSFV
ncbi:Xre family transcriptional regulator (plasmid) [Acidiphilium multivorum AIU301]|jgi:DNA-binding XRE family transcriptional regulator|uniref:Xre family transcriptional regulator n=1 Tax=Acidiphilium multivorum (strain DSM 11245 / JCM 8867 / NBRC 100883 / AIU 301) TaxID=926570 RepID=F0J7P2_ACIMA|nr:MULTISPECIES: helix-turn-helix domain-containing protein [Acidiphilium]KDM68375.1 Xre family transcriptional regulator [Acidiphilium sp. JA12-A1]BAJ83109.1 Xre family transcriptional regulator [Acidiphilium multivorum AIU301]GAN73405.1 transcriptional regulator XRE [Acidiphilium multivorum AIU301]